MDPELQKEKGKNNDISCRMHEIDRKENERRQRKREKERKKIVERQRNRERENLQGEW